MGWCQLQPKCQKFLCSRGFRPSDWTRHAKTKDKVEKFVERLGYLTKNKFKKQTNKKQQKKTKKTPKAQHSFLLGRGGKKKIELE